MKLSIHQLNAALSFQKAILDNAGAMIIATDQKGIIKLFNPLGLLIYQVPDCFATGHF